MAFPWELNIDHEYRDRKWDRPDDFCQADSEKWVRADERSNPLNPAKRKASSSTREAP
jgi:hypothetical protein